MLATPALSPAPPARTDPARAPLLDPDSDRMLVIRAAAGDDRAFAALVQRYSTLVRATAARALGATAEVDDVVQETFLAAWTHVDSASELGLPSSTVRGMLSRARSTLRVALTGWR